MYSLHKYFKQSSVVPSSTSTYSFLSKKDIESANDSVGTAFAKKPATTSRVGLKYNTYTPEQRAEIGKYAAENGNTSAARHFSKVLDFKVSESIARRLKSKYLRALESRSDHVVKSLPTKPQGRPLLLRQEIDKQSKSTLKQPDLLVEWSTLLLSWQQLLALCQHETRQPSNPIGGILRSLNHGPGLFLTEWDMSKENVAMLVKFRLLISWRSKMFF